MAEFQDVMRQAKRMCNEFSSGLHSKYCDECPVSSVLNGKCSTCTDVMRGDPEWFEKTVMNWAAEHPEPRYPSWEVAWKQLFPDAEEAFAPCLKRMLPSEQTHKYCAVYPNPLCKQCRAQPIPADIAEKLGIKPIGGTIEQPKMSQIEVNASKGLLAENGNHQCGIMEE